MLAASLLAYAGRSDVIVLGLPRGGVPVAYEVAAGLQAPLDVIVVRKLGVPGLEELAMGAVATGGVRLINERTVKLLGVSPEAVEQTINREMQELRRRELAYRGHEGVPEVHGRTVILVDDGMATGSTFCAAVKAVRQRHPKAVVAAAPLGSADACELLGTLVDDLVVLQTPEMFRAVGQWYEDFTQTTDAEVRNLLSKAAQNLPVQERS